MFLISVCRWCSIDVLENNFSFVGRLFVVSSLIVRESPSPQSKSQSTTSYNNCDPTTFFFMRFSWLCDFVTRPLWRHALLNRSLLLLDVRRFIKFLTGCLVQSLLNTLFADILYLQTFLKVSNLQFDVGKVTINCVCDLCKRCKYFFIKKNCWKGMLKGAWETNMAKKCFS